MDVTENGRVFVHPRKGKVYLRYDLDGNPVTEWQPPTGWGYVTKGHALCLEKMGYKEVE